MKRPLTAIELRVLEAYCAKNEPTQAQVCKQLGYAPGTVSRHLVRIYDALEVHTLLGAYRVCRDELDVGAEYW